MRAVYKFIIWFTVSLLGMSFITSIVSNEFVMSFITALIISFLGVKDAD